MWVTGWLSHTSGSCHKTEWLIYDNWTWIRILCLLLYELCLRCCWFWILGFSYWFVVMLVKKRLWRRLWATQKIIHWSSTCYSRISSRLRQRSVNVSYLLIISLYVHVCFRREKDWKCLLAVINALSEARTLLDCNNQRLLFVSLLHWCGKKKLWNGKCLFFNHKVNFNRKFESLVCLFFEGYCSLLENKDRDWYLTILMNKLCICSGVPFGFIL